MHLMAAKKITKTISLPFILFSLIGLSASLSAIANPATKIKSQNLKVSTTSNHVIEPANPNPNHHEIRPETWFYMGSMDLKSGNLDSAESQFLRAVKLFEQQNRQDTQEYSLSLIGLGNVAKQRGKYELAQSYFDKALLANKSIKDSETQAMLYSAVYINIGLLNSSLGNNNKALSYYKKAEKAAVHASEAYRQNPNYSGKLHNNMGLAYFNLSRYHLALEQFLLSQKLFGDEINDSFEQAMLLNNIAMVYDALGDSEKAMSYLNKALAMPILDDFLLDKANILTNLSFSHSNLGNDEQAESYLKQALAIMKDIDPKHPQVATIYNYLGNIYLNREDWQAALESLQASEKLSKEVYGRHYFTGVVDKTNIASALLGMDDDEGAERYLMEALTLSQQPDYVEDSNIASLYSLLAFINQTNDKPTEALKYYQEALRVNKKFFGEHHQLVASSYDDIARFYYHQDDLPQALGYFKKAEASISKAKTVDPYYLNSIYSGLQSVYEDMGDKTLAKRYTDKLAALD